MKGVVPIGLPFLYPQKELVHDKRIESNSSSFQMMCHKLICMVEWFDWNLVRTSNCGCWHMNANHSLVTLVLEWLFRRVWIDHFLLLVHRDCDQIQSTWFTAAFNFKTSFWHLPNTFFPMPIIYHKAAYRHTMGPSISSLSTEQLHHRKPLFNL